MGALAYQIENAIEAHKPEDYYVIRRKVYMIIDQKNRSHAEYAIKCNDLETDLPDDGHWIKPQGLSRFETISGACRALLIYLVDSESFK